MTVSVTQVGVGSFSTNANVAVSVTPAAGDVVVLMVPSNAAAAVTMNSVSGLGATWTITNFTTTQAGSVAIGVGATSSGTITATWSASWQRTMRVYLVSGLGAGYSETIQSTVQGSSTGTLTGPSNAVAAGAIVIESAQAGNGSTMTWNRTGYTTDANGLATNGINITASSAYVIPGSSGTYGTSVSMATATASRIMQVILTPASGSTGTVAATAPAATSTIVGSVVATGTVAATAPSASAAIVGDVPTPVTGDVTATAPAASSSIAGTVSTTGTLAAAAPSASVFIAGSGIIAGSVDATAPAASAAIVGSVPNVGTVDATAPAASAAMIGDVVGATPTTLLDFRIPRRFDWAENGTQVDTVEVTVLRFASRRGFTMRGLLTPVAPPLGVLTEWPIQRQAHLMPALTAATPRFRVGNPANPGEYAVDYGDTGRLHVFVGGVDVTYLRGVPAGFDDYSSAVPVNATSATVKLPQLKPWDQPGTGDLFMLSKDAPVEVVMVRPDDTLDYKWEGFFQVDEENSGTGEDYTFRAQGLFYQAAHEPWDPPVVLEPTDIGWLVADAMNGVTHRRWAKIPRVDTGIMSRNRGSQGQSVWQYVQDLLSQAWTDDGRQWTLARVAPYTYRIQVKAAMTDVHWTVTKGAPGVEVNLSEDQSTRRDAIYGRGFAPDGGYWCGRVFPGLEFGVPPRYPMNNTSLTLDGRSDSTTDTGNGVTTWQRQMRELGYPVTVDGVMNPADVKWVRKIQRDRGLTVDGSLGPQTWAATWENNATDADLTSYRLPLATLPSVEPWLYSGTGAKVGTNPADDKTIIRHAMPEVDFGSGVKKSEAIELARKMLAREQTPGVSGTVSLVTDPHESGSSRFDIKPGDNVKVRGHRGADVVLQVVEVSVQGLSVNLTVDSRARDALTVLAILERNRDALRDPSARNGTTDGSSLNKASVVQYESESKAGTIPRTAVNGDTGLWTIRKTFVSQVGVAKIAFTATSPKAELCVALFNRPIRTSVLAAMVADPLADSNGWYDNEQKLREQYGLMEIFGGPGNPGGYFPRQKGKGPLTGRLEDTGSTLYDSPYGGFVWVAMFTSRSTWVEGRVFPAVPT